MWGLGNYSIDHEIFDCGKTRKVSPPHRNVDKILDPFGQQEPPVFTSTMKDNAGLETNWRN